LTPPLLLVWFPRIQVAPFCFSFLRFSGCSRCLIYRFWSRIILKVNCPWSLDFSSMGLIYSYLTNYGCTCRTILLALVHIRRLALGLWHAYLKYYEYSTHEAISMTLILLSVHQIGLLESTTT
jgi:hypothetical protein